MGYFTKWKLFLLFVFTGFFITSCFFVEKNKKKHQGTKLQSTYPCFFELTPGSVKYGDSITVSKAANVEWSSIRSISVLGKTITEQNPTLQISAKSTTSLRGTATYNDGSMKYCEQLISVTSSNSDISCSLTASPAEISRAREKVTVTLTVMGEDTSKIKDTLIRKGSLSSNTGGSVELWVYNTQPILGTVELENDEKAYCEFQVRNHSENFCKSAASELEYSELGDKNQKLDLDFEETLRLRATSIIGADAQKSPVQGRTFLYNLPNSICEGFSNDSDCSVHNMKRVEDFYSADLKEVGVFQVNGKYYEYYLLKSGVNFSLYRSSDSYSPILYKVDTDWEYQDLEVCECKNVENGPFELDGPVEAAGILHFFEINDTEKDKDLDLESTSIVSFNKTQFKFRKNIIPPGPGETQPVCSWY